MAALVTSPAAATEDVPFITTPDPVALAMLKLAHVKPTDRVLDLGSGDGRIVILAAKRFGARGLGVEIVPELVDKSRANALRAGVEHRVEFRVQDLFKTDLSRASVITMYLLPDVNLQLRPSLLALKPGTRIVSHDWDMGEWAPDRSLTLDVPQKAIGREKVSRVHLWVVPARVDGTWCSAVKSSTVMLKVTQHFQAFSAEIEGDEALPGFNGRLDGARLNAAAGGAGDLHLVSIGDRLRVSRARGAYAALVARVFKPAVDGSCNPAR
jgi:SAM-dependent methyltransferase